MFKALTQIQVNIYKHSLKIFPLKNGGSFESQMLHELSVLANEEKDRFARIIQPLLSTTLITAAVTIYLFGTLGIMSLILPLSMLLTITITLTYNKSIKVNDTGYRERLLDFFDGFEELKSAKSADEAVGRLDEAAADLKETERLKRIKIINVDSVCAVVNVVLMLMILKELAGLVDIIDLSIWLFILLVIFDMINTLPNVGNGVNEVLADDMALCVKDVSFGYSDLSNVLRNVRLEVKRGAKIAIIGESGSGKTTLLYLILKLWQPDSGHIFVNGSIAAATVNNYIFSQSVRENFLIMHPNITEGEIIQALRICQLDDLDLDREIGENGVKISGGERNRLQTALALASNSDILILDEPTAGLDKITATNLINSIINVTNEKDRTLIVITHDLSVARSMENIFRLYEGKIICEG